MPGPPATLVRRRCIAWAIVLLGASLLALTPTAASGGPRRPSVQASTKVDLGRTAVIAHAGATSRARSAATCRAAVLAAEAVLSDGGDAIDAAVAGVVVLEDDPRLNAGTGSRIRIDGITIQMDAAVMGSDGTSGAVAAIEQVRNPILVARAVIDTPHVFLVGDGATRFARQLGMKEYDPTTERAQREIQVLLKWLLRYDRKTPREWIAFPWKQHWNAARSVEAVREQIEGSDTVGVAVRGADGRFATAISTGGAGLMLLGRVGDVPIPGAGHYAAAAGAVVATGKGERIIETLLSRQVYDRLAAGDTAAEALAHGLAVMADKGKVGLVVLTATDLAGGSSSGKMAWAGRVAGREPWLGTVPPTETANQDDDGGEVELED